MDFVLGLCAQKSFRSRALPRTHSSEWKFPTSRDPFQRVDAYLYCIKLLGSSAVSSVARAIDCSSIGRWFKSDTALIMHDH